MDHLGGEGTILIDCSGNRVVAGTGSHPCVPCECPVQNLSQARENKVMKQLKEEGFGWTPKAFLQPEPQRQLSRMVDHILRQDGKTVSV